MAAIWKMTATVVMVQICDGPITKTIPKNVPNICAKSYACIKAQFLHKFAGLNTKLAYETIAIAYTKNTHRCLQSMVAIAT